MLRHLWGAALALALSCALAQGSATAQEATRGAFRVAGTSIADTRAHDATLGDWMAPVPAGAARAPAARPATAAEIHLPVAAGAIAPGDKITDDMLVDRAFPSSVASQYPIAITRAQLVGKVARRVLLAGNVIPVAAVGDAKVVTRGVAAELRFEQDGLVITALGVPLDSGTVGAVVRLKNIDSGKVVTGVVQDDGSVKVGGK
ncbi:flagellar basal body P-ring formation chaperone FlgA [Ancylobacter radicis]|uniref:Flagella basal body P-ring formation protein FlgA n=1 Tax=Ancylobacter radicis TaxID=2836179 RepID=A0ABS5RCR0_9HYPH|nr:flagellar basal body P-ring formation chaperone FlgA [Ancylobacter radicis]MBS9479317.1 flagellar basal body P-ring formation protein FlgA [Ancylobacter radicis]